MIRFLSILFHKHDWKRWEDNGRFAWYQSGHVGERAYQVKQKLGQIRECRTCGAKQQRYI